MKSKISKTTQIKYILTTHSDEFWESLKLFAVAIVFLLVAAFIEANITTALGNYIISVT